MSNETYKYNQAECTHQGKWDENMLGRTCLDCGFDTLCNDNGMYGEPITPRQNYWNMMLFSANKLKELEAAGKLYEQPINSN
jgi:hypothetical protein